MDLPLWNLPVLLLIGAIGYFLGNVQMALIVSRTLFHDDVRLYGSGNAGTTNMVRVYGKQYGIVTFLGDACKALLAFLLGRLLGGVLDLLPSDPLLSKELGGCIAGTLAVFGHCYPAIYGFRGGKGAASSFALIWCFCWQAALATTVAIVVIFIASKRMSLVSTLSAVLFALFSTIAYFLGWIPVHLLYFIYPIALLVLVRHRSNIKRLLRGQEAALDINGKPLREQNITKQKEK